MWESAKQDPYSTSKRRTHALPRFGNMSQPFASRRRLSGQFMVYSSVGGTAATCLVLKGSPKTCHKSVGSHSLSVRSVMGGGRDQALEPGRQCLVHDGLLYVTKTDRSQGTSWGTWDEETTLWGATRFSSGGTSTEYGATCCWRLRPPPWVENEAYRGSGADPRRDLGVSSFCGTSKG
ncbi:hypothetical protein THAR02_08734 [Trichoderma harzianum]|uniref:Uncharacterized protein n=1 Tax=Trichoderma harzianum TaxID=5544 RepID=A0A0F9X3D8_TRIHA|nr:hypothetical protein THAR02_08734 [Trichoderma harzianum]